MCTVTYVPTAEGFYLTSNRDESRHRSSATPPMVYTKGTEKLIYPRDADAGGSWIALKENGVSAVLLNGAFLKHLRKPPYRMSRGMVLLEIIRKTDPVTHLAGMDLNGIEPFTLILFSKGILWDCRWDGHRRHITPLDSASPHIWSSATLYDERTANERKRWFYDWVKHKEQIVQTELVGFHQSAGNGDIRNSLVMNRDNELFTVSVTSIVVKKGDARMLYHDLRKGQNTLATFSEQVQIQSGEIRSYKSTLQERFGWWVKRFWTRLTHWEFWPTHVVYTPLYLYWVWLSIRARSFFFFNAANPRIEYAGFIHERKSDIYRQLPDEYYPRTHFCPACADWELLKVELDNRGFHFPLIAKPDIGERGAQVSLLQTSDQLVAYCRRSKVDFLIQEYVSYEYEAGIFYVRIPGESKGRITGIVGKEFLAVAGDGRSTMRQLLVQDPRSLLQLATLEARYGSFLNTVLPEGVSQTLVPYGNHSLGARFIDRGDKITPRLNEVIDGICKRIPDFYFGRLDMKFASWEDLLKGKNFSIIEVNGAGSEPTHIYDPSHSLFFAWKEIIRHWRLLYRISLANAERKKIPLMGTREGLRMIAAHSRYLKLIEQL